MAWLYLGHTDKVQGRQGWGSPLGAKGEDPCKQGHVGLEGEASIRDYGLRLYHLQAVLPLAGR